MRRVYVPVCLAFAAALLSIHLQTPAAPAQTKPKHPKHKEAVLKQGQGVILELDNDFIDKYAHRATITSEFTVTGVSAVHPAKNDGEVHAGGWAHEAGLACVSEVMNAANKGKPAVKVFRAALSDDQKLTVTGAWRLWAEHAGTAQQIQMPNMPEKLPGEHPSNPDHLFEIHPVTSVKLGNKVTDATDAIGETPGFTPYDAQTAFELGYQKLSCKIVPLPNGRTRIITEAARYNFAQFVIRFAEDPHKLVDGHAAICSVYDTDGEFVLKNRRMVFVKGTDADDLVQDKKEGDRLKVIGIPRISLMLIKWRLEHAKDKGYDVSPLEWRLPYEMIIVAAAPLHGDN